MSFLDFVREFYCHSCDKMFPKSTLMYYNGYPYCTKCYSLSRVAKTTCANCGVETAGNKLCKSCNTVRTSEETMRFCDGCGEDYPRTHLVYVDLYDGQFCDRCSRLESEEA